MEQTGFAVSHRVGMLVLSVVLVGIVLELVRSHRFKERYALLWLGASLVCLLIGLFPSLIVWTAQLFRVQYLTVFFATAFVFILGLVLSFSVVISQLTERNRELAQEVGLLSARVKDLENGPQGGT